MFGVSGQAAGGIGVQSFELRVSGSGFQLEGSKCRVAGCGLDPGTGRGWGGAEGRCRARLAREEGVPVNGAPAAT